MDNLKLDDVSSQFMEAALGLKPWTSVLEGVASASSAFGVNLMPIRTQRSPTFVCTPSIVESGQYYFKNEIYKRCIRQRAVPLMEANGVAFDAEYTSEWEREHDPYYQEFLRPFGLKWSAYLGFEVEGDLLSCMLHRKIDQNPFGVNDLGALRQMRSQLRTAAIISRHIDNARLGGLQEALNIADLPFITFGFDTKVVSLNASAERILKGELQIIDKKLICRFREDTLALLKAVDNLASGRSGISSGINEVLKLRRQVGQALTIRLIRCGGSLMDAFKRVAVIGILVDPAQKPREPTELFASLYGLTPAELRIANRLAAGEKLSVIAEKLNITYETARVHLRNIFDKTETTRQGELIAMMSGYR